jgi:hypothetical protein
MRKPFNCVPCLSAWIMIVICWANWEVDVLMVCVAGTVGAFVDVLYDKLIK